MTSADISSPLILVLLPVYNGQRFLAAQLDSILGQSWRALKLLIRDDCSSDRSMDIIGDYASRFPDRIDVVQDPTGNLGASASFNRLLEEAMTRLDSDYRGQEVYVALADQDDVWLPNKLELCLQVLRQQETFEPGVPLLVHSDLTVVDQDLKVIAESFTQYQGLKPNKRKFVNQLLSNTVTGCTAVLNRACLEKALPVASAAIMHDWWLSLVASRFGRILFVPDKLVLYRQHGANTVGAHKHSSGRRLSEREAQQAADNRQVVLQKTADQADAFAGRFDGDLLWQDRLAIRLVRMLPRCGPWPQRVVFRVLKNWHLR